MSKTSELNIEKYKNIHNIENSIKNGTDLYHRDISFNKISINKGFPKYLVENLDKYKEWIVDLKFGEVAEWLKAHAWKACKGAILSWVRIPFSPPLNKPCFSTFI